MGLNNKIMHFGCGGGLLAAVLPEANSIEKASQHSDPKFALFCVQKIAVKINDKVIEKRRNRGSESPTKRKRLDPMSDDRMIVTPPPSASSSSERKVPTTPPTDADVVESSHIEMLDRPSDNEDDKLENALAAWPNTTDQEMTPSTSPVSDLPPREQLRRIETLMKSSLVDGETWYIISNAWFAAWKEYCYCTTSTSAGTPPGPIDNASILKDEHLIANLQIDQDFHVVPEEAWEHLCHW